MLERRLSSYRDTTKISNAGSKRAPAPAVRLTPHRHKKSGPGYERGRSQRPCKHLVDVDVACAFVPENVLRRAKGRALRCSGTANAATWLHVAAFYQARKHRCFPSYLEAGASQYGFTP